MRKQLGIFASLLFLCAAALYWTGCSSNYDCCEPNYCSAPYGTVSLNKPVFNSTLKPASTFSAPIANLSIAQPRQMYQNRPSCQPPRQVCPPRPACPPIPCRPVCPEPGKVCAPPCKSCPPDFDPITDDCCKAAAPCKHPPQGEICFNGVTVRAKQPKMCVLGETYPLDVEVTGCTDVCDVVVHANLPEGVTVVRSQPEDSFSMGDDGRAVWKINHLDKGQTERSRIFLRADREGDLCVCFCVTAVPVQFCGLVCAKPVLTCEKCGPEEVCPGDPVHYTISVTNHGTCAAEEVVVTDMVPDGLEHASGLTSLVFKLGTLQACETKKINVCFTAVKRGKVCNNIIVTSCNANQTSCQWCTNVCLQCIDLVKVGPKEVPIGKTAEYTITVKNPGDKSLTDIVLTDVAPVATSIVEAEGAEVTGNQAVWRFDELKPGEQRDFTLVLTTCTPGYFCNKVQVTNCQGCCATAEACTRWRGRSALNVCVAPAENPVCVGDTNSYSVRVVNQGSEEDNNVQVRVTFPSEFKPLAGSGPTPAKVEGQTVTFAPYQHFGARQTLEYRIEAQAVQSGDDPRVKVEVTSDGQKSALTEETSTIVN